MEVTAKLNTFRIAPQKMRLVADLVRNLNIKDALVVLNNTNKRASKPIKKLVNSAINNAVNNFGLTVEQLHVKSIYVNEGPRLKRAIPSCRGNQKPILKRTSHVTVVLSNVRKEKKS